MTFSSIVNMAEDHIKIGVMAGTILVMDYIIGNFLLYQRIFQGKKQLRFRKPWIIYMAGAAFSASIEIIQLIFHWGIVETDDILNNLLGVAIGYGGYRLLSVLFRAHRSGRGKVRLIFTGCR